MCHALDIICQLSEFDLPSREIPPLKLVSKAVASAIILILHFGKLNHSVSNSPNPFHESINLHTFVSSSSSGYDFIVSLFASKSILFVIKESLICKIEIVSTKVDLTMGK